MTDINEVEEEEDRVRRRERRQRLIINFGHCPLKKSLPENQDVARGRDGGEIQFHSTYLLSTLYLLNPCDVLPHLSCSACFKYLSALHAFFTQITDTALTKAFIL